MTTSELTELLLLLRSHGVAEYSGNGVSVRFGSPAKPEFAAATGKPVPTGLDAAKLADPRLNTVLDRLPSAYSDPRLWSPE